MKTITGNTVRQSYAMSGTRVHSIEEACNAIPFTVVSEPGARFSTGQAIPNTQDLFRSDNGYCLGRHTPQFQYLQPCESLKTLEKARELIGGQWASVRANKGGKQIMGFITLENEITAPSRGDKVGFSVGFVDFFDGSGNCTLGLYANVLVCDNGMTASKALVSFRGKHNGSLSARFEVMAKKLHTNLLLEIGHTKEIIISLDTKPMARSEVQVFAERLFPTKEGEETSTRTENMREAIVTGFTRGTGNVGRTRWDAMNAVTEYLDWQSTFRETEFSREENRLDSLINGNAAGVRERALELLLA